MKSVKIFASTEVYFEEGQNILRGETTTDVTVSRIKTWFSYVCIYLSNKETITYYGIPYLLNKK